MKNELIQTLEELGIHELLEIQKKAIPFIEEGKDVFVKSPTGSGKTFAYLIPAIDRIDRNEMYTKVLIIVPTRELALQVADNAKKLSVRTGNHVVTLIGGMDISRQMNALRHRPQILIGTPGRIVDLLHQDCIDLSELSLLIFDEADQIISTGQSEETEEIRNFIPDVQTVCLSATENELTDKLFPGNCEFINMILPSFHHLLLLREVHCISGCCIPLFSSGSTAHGHLRWQSFHPQSLLHSTVFLEADS